MKANERRAKLAAVTRFERAVSENTLKGSYHPDTHDEIERLYVLAKANLYRKLGFEVAE